MTQYNVSCICPSLFCFPPSLLLRKKDGRFPVYATQEGNHKVLSPSVHRYLRYFCQALMMYNRQHSNKGRKVFLCKPGVKIIIYLFLSQKWNWNGAEVGAKVPELKEACLQLPSCTNTTLLPFVEWVHCLNCFPAHAHTSSHHTLLLTCFLSHTQRDTNRAAILK